VREAPLDGWDDGQGDVTFPELHNKVKQLPHTVTSSRIVVTPRNRSHLASAPSSTATGPPFFQSSAPGGIALHEPQTALANAYKLFQGRPTGLQIKRKIPRRGIIPLRNAGYLPDLQDERESPPRATASSVSSVDGVP